MFTLEYGADTSLIDKVKRRKEQEMAFIILLLLIGVPILELTVLIDVGKEIGAFSAVILCLLTAAIGLSLVRLQGLIVMANMQKAAQSGEPIGESLIHGFFLLVAGFFLLIPGFVTDGIGALLLIPPIRLLLGKAGLAHTIVRSRGGKGKTTTIIEGEFYEADTKDPRDRVETDTDKTRP